MAVVVLKEMALYIIKTIQGELALSQFGFVIIKQVIIQKKSN
jgi:hypothetical protein